MDHAAIVSAAAQGYTATSSPTSARTHVTDKQANVAYLLRYFQTLNLDEHDVRAVYPKFYTQQHSTLVTLKSTISRLRTKINNSFLSTNGSASSQRWFARVVNSFVLLHEFESHMFNLQRDILLANIALINETEAAQKPRLEYLEALKKSFTQHKDAMIDKINCVETYAPRHLEGKDSDGKYANVEDPWYFETLKKIRVEYQSMHLWDPVANVLDVPPRKLTYIEKYGTGLRRSHDFWGPVWANPGYAESFFSEFKDVIYLPAALDNDTHPECAKHMQVMFQLAAHYSWTTASSPPLVFFDTMRSIFARRSRLEFRHIPLRDPDYDEEGPAACRAKRRKL